MESDWPWDHTNFEQIDINVYIVKVSVDHKIFQLQSVMFWPMNSAFTMVNLHLATCICKLNI